MSDEELERLEGSARMVVERGGSTFADGLARDMAITVLALLERVRKAEAEAADLNWQLADLERKALCPNFDHEWGPVSTEGQTVTTCTRCPASIRAVEFRPMQKP